VHVRDQSSVGVRDVLSVDTQPHLLDAPARAVVGIDSDVDAGRRVLEDLPVLGRGDPYVRGFVVVTDSIATGLARWRR